MKYAFRMISLVLFLCGGIWIESLYGQTQASGAQETPAENALPEPYTEGEFPLFLKDIGRFEIIAVGSLPLAWFVSSLGFEISRYISHDFDTSYMPWPFKNEFTEPFNQSERLAALWTAVGCSVGIATIDFIIMQAIRSKKEIKAGRSRH